LTHSKEALSVKPVSRGIDRIVVTFDDPNLVANAGLLLVATLVRKLGLEDLCDKTIGLMGRTGGFRPGRKILTLVHAMVAGATYIDHADMLRAGSTDSVLGHRVMAPSTLGTFLRAFSFGHVRQFEKVIGDALHRAWDLGAGPGEHQLVVDIDSTIREVFGKFKSGAAYGYTKVLGYHPILATRADTGEILHARMRKGSANTQRGTKRSSKSSSPGCAGPGPAARSSCVLTRGIGPTRPSRCSLAWGSLSPWPCARAPKPWTRPLRPSTSLPGCQSSTRPGGEAMVAECTYKGHRLIVRRTRLVGPQASLWPNWRHFAFLSDLEASAVELDAFHRRHAVVELCIDDWKEGAGMEHCPSGDFSANAAWMCCAVLAYNLIPWSAHLGGLVEEDTLVVARTLRVRHFSVPARVVNRSGTPTRRGPTQWPWARSFARALTNLRAVTFAPT
jgi:hypothetical protein